MNSIEIFKNEEFGEIRTLTIDNEPWFVGKDVADILGYKDTFGALQKHVDDEDKQNCQNDSFDSPRGMIIINESGLYSLILSSKLPTAKKFKRWVTSEVLPSIRKHGAYATEVTIDNILKNPDFGIELLQQLKKERKEKEVLQKEKETLVEEKETLVKEKGVLQDTVDEQAETISNMAPKSYYYDMVMRNPGTVTVSTIAQDYGMSGTAFNRLLADKGIQYRKGKTWYVYNEYAEQGWIQSSTLLLGNMLRHFSKTNMQWTQIGRLGIYDLLKKDGILPLIEKDKSEQMQIETE